MRPIAGTDVDVEETLCWKSLDEFTWSGVVINVFTGAWQIRTCPWRLPSFNGRRLLANSQQQRRLEPNSIPNLTSEPNPHPTPTLPLILAEWRKNIRTVTTDEPKNIKSFYFRRSEIFNRPFVLTIYFSIFWN